ncbi:LmeA family phospholipid-binding protein [Cyanobium sp. LEGE 06113]|jgi:hypothetical protein|uniref:LmeA family phospholipid-binding protein n=2 Tax=unclassified Cyanobium TaxID=2627006 RepID=UPI001D13F368|nr:LmeA family phospholipid-binding protein [Cyanobium sp. LEGE 06113]
MSGPLLQLLATGLQLWIRRQCEQIGALSLELEGRDLQLLRGRLAGAQLQARQVRYRGLELDAVTLTSEPISLQVAGLRRGQAIELGQPFGIRGEVRFSPEGLEHSLAQASWQPLADQLAGQLLGSAAWRGSSLSLRREHLVLRSHGALELETSLSAEAGTVLIRAVDGSAELRLPMDPAVRIERAAVENGRLVLQGRATVTP